MSAETESSHQADEHQVFSEALSSTVAQLQGARRGHLSMFLPPSSSFMAPAGRSLSSLPPPSPSSSLGKFFPSPGIVPYSSFLSGGGDAQSSRRRQQELQQRIQFLTDTVHRVVGAPAGHDDELHSLRAELQAQEAGRVQAQQAYDELLRAYQEQRQKNAELMEEVARLNEALVHSKAALRAQRADDRPPAPCLSAGSGEDSDEDASRQPTSADQSDTDHDRDSDDDDDDDTDADREGAASAEQDLLQTSELVESFFQQTSHQVTELEAVIEQQREQIAALQRGQAELVEQQQALRAALGRAEAEQQQAAERAAAAERQHAEQMEELQEKNHSVQAFADQLVKELASMKIAHRTSQQKLAQLEEHSGALHVQREQTSQAARLLHEEISTLNREKKAREALFRSQEEDLAAQRQHVAELQAELQAARDRADALDEALRAGQQKLNAQQLELAQLGRYKQHIVELTSRLKNQVSTRMSSSASASASASLTLSPSSASTSFDQPPAGSLPLFSPIVPLPPGRRSARPAATPTPLHPPPPSSSSSLPFEVAARP